MVWIKIRRRLTKVINDQSGTWLTNRSCNIWAKITQQESPLFNVTTNKLRIDFSRILMSCSGLGKDLRCTD